MLSAAKGLSAALGCHPEPIRFAQGKLREGSARGAQRCFAALSMTGQDSSQGSPSPLTAEVFSPNVQLFFGKLASSFMMDYNGTILFPG